MDSSFLALRRVTHHLSPVQETLDFLAQPQELDPGSLPPGLAGWDPTSLLFSSIPITAWVLGLQLLHDSSHRVVAANKKVLSQAKVTLPHDACANCSISADCTHARSELLTIS